MTVPDDLRVYIGNGRVELHSGGNVVDITFHARNGIFSDGPLSWKRLVMAYLEPALWQLTHAGQVAKPKPTNGQGANA